MDIGKKVLLFTFLLLFIVSLSFVSSYKVNTEIPFKATCTSSGAICSSSADCNITIKYPNETLMVYSQAMTNNDNGIFNITLNSTLVSTLGENNWNMFCCDGTECNEGFGSFIVTKTGTELDEGQGLTIIGTIIVLCLVACTFLFFGLKIEYLPFKIFLTALGFLFITLVTGISVSIIDQLMLSGSVLIGTVGGLYRLLLILASGGGAGLMLYLVYMSVRQFYSYRGLLDKDGD